MKKGQQYKYYHQRIKKTFSFIIPPNKKILLEHIAQSYQVVWYKNKEK